MSSKLAVEPRAEFSDDAYLEQDVNEWARAQMAP
jgi:hypothetical protein